MVFVFIIMIVLTAALVMLLLDLIAAGLAALLGARFRTVFKWGLWSLLLPPLMFFYGMFYERNAYKVREVEIVSEAVPQECDGYRIVQISDMHLASYKNRHKSLSRAVGMINELNPDVVAFTGDLVTYLPSEMDGFEEILSGLHASDGVYSVLGNHDYCIYNNWENDSLRAAAVQQVVAREEALGWKVLMNENVTLASGAISLVGVENISSSPHFPSYGDLDAAMDGADGSFKVLLSHDPTFWHSALEIYPDINLTLSGHTHAMQFALFGWSPSKFLYKENMGLYRDSLTGAALYVNIGLGQTAMPARIGTRPEITLITLRHRASPDSGSGLGTVSVPDSGSVPDVDSGR